jgi:hypothetical protein
MSGFKQDAIGYQSANRGGRYEFTIDFTSRLGCGGDRTARAAASTWRSAVRIGIWLCITLAAIAGMLGASVATSAIQAPNTNPKHFFWAPGQSPQGTVDSVANDIIYHGGNAGPGAIGVETKPAVYLIYWGPEWASGFTTNDAAGKSYSSKTLQTYLNSFFANVGGSAWAGVQTQYCRNVPAGATSCAESRAPITSLTRSTS